MKNRYTTMIAAGLIALVLAAIFLPRYLQKAPSQSAVKIAVNLPLTGPQAAFSGEYPMGLKMGLEEGSAAHGIDPAVFQLNLQDNQGSSKNAVTIFENHKRSGFDAYISGLSTASVAIAPELDKMDVSHFFVAFEAFITRDGSNRFRVLPSYKSEGPKYAEYARYKKAKRVFMLTLNLAPVDEEFSRFVEPELAKMGVEQQREKFDLTTTDYRSLALKAIAYKPDLVIINGLSFNILPLIQSLKSLGFAMDGNVLCVMDLIDLLYGKEIPQELEGVVFISPPFEIPGVVPGADDWRNRFRQRGGKIPNYVQSYAYDTGRILVEAYVKQKSLKPDSVKAVFPYEGISGKMALDADRDLVTDLGFVKIVAGGKRERIEVPTR